MDEAQNTAAEAAGAESAAGEGSQTGAATQPADSGSLMSRAAAEEKADGGKADETQKPEAAAQQKPDPSAQVPETPEGYALTFGKDTQVDATLLKDFQKTAHELGLTQAQAQKLGSLYEAHAAQAMKQAQEEQTKALLDARAKWEAQITASPSFREDLGLIQGALRQFGSQELYDLLDQTNLGSHPVMFAFMAKVGRALAEPGFHGERAGANRSAAEVLYPNMK